MTYFSEGMFKKTVLRIGKFGMGIFFFPREIYSGQIVCYIIQSEDKNSVSQEVLGSNSNLKHFSPSVKPYKVSKDEKLLQLVIYAD